MPPWDLLRMPEREFQQFQDYAARRMLPSRRMELYMAQLAMLFAKSGGAQDVELSDFLFDPEDDAPPTFDEVAEAFEFRPRN